VRAGRVRFVTRARTMLSLLVVSVAALLVSAPGALAADGVGLYGRTDDKVVTMFMFGVMIFFVVLVVTLSLIQIRLEGRKERMRADLERLRRP
jgi:hypothetical protein